MKPDIFDAGVITHCRNVLNQHAAWIYSLPEAAIHKLAPKIQQIAEVLGSFEACYRRTHKSLTSPGSQCEEDAIIAQLLPPPMMGTYIDIGAGEPQQCSNTWALYQRGWRGLLVEPLPEFLFELIRWRPGDMVFPVIASNETGIIPFFVNQSLSSCLATWSQGAPITPLAAERMAVSEILDMPDFQRFRDSCDLCSIDVEGHETQVLSAIPWDRFSPQVFCVEYRKYNPSKLGEDLSPEWEPILLANGYVLHATTILNKIYTKLEAAVPEPDAPPAA